ncbi:MAG: hypothetical protein ACJ8NR_11295 [Sulfurifustis sp.]
MSEAINLDRRRFMGTAMITIAVAQFGTSVLWTRAPMPRNFLGKYAHRVITGGIGHNLPQEAPHAFAEAIREIDSYVRS